MSRKNKLAEVLDYFSERKVSLNITIRPDQLEYLNEVEDTLKLVGGKSRIIRQALDLLMQDYPCYATKPSSFDS